MNQIILKINNKDKVFYLKDIKTINPYKSTMLVFSDPYYDDVSDDNPLNGEIFTQISFDSQIEFRRLKFEWIKEVKSRADQDDRVEWFEYTDKSMIPDFEKREKLLLGRRTFEEIATDKEERNYLFTEFKKHKIPMSTREV